MSKKHLIRNPYRPGDENRLQFDDPALLKKFYSALALVARYFRYEVIGLENIPRDSGALLVLNHGLFPIDQLLLARRISLDLGRRTRTLAHRRSWMIPVLREIALNMGIVNATPANAVQLLKKGELVCVFPGGEREGTKPSSKKYRLLWEGRHGFIKVAIAAGVPIIPCMSVGVDDLYHVFPRPSGRISIFLSRYLPLPAFLGLGWFPLPRKITQFIGRPIRHRHQSVRALHALVWRRSRRLLEDGLRMR